MIIALLTKKRDKKCLTPAPRKLKTDCLLWYAEFKDPIKTQRKFKTKYGRNVKPPSVYCTKGWVGNFKKTGSISPKKIRSNSVERQRIVSRLPK